MPFCLNSYKTDVLPALYTAIHIRALAWTPERSGIHALHGMFSDAVLPGHQPLPPPDPIRSKDRTVHSGYPVTAEGSDKTGEITAHSPRACYGDRFKRS